MADSNQRDKTVKLPFFFHLNRDNMAARGIVATQVLTTMIAFKLRIAIIRVFYLEKVIKKKNCDWLTFVDIKR